MEQPNILQILKNALAEICTLQQENAVMKEQLAAIRTVSGISKGYDTPISKVRTVNVISMIQTEIRAFTQGDTQRPEPLPVSGPGVQATSPL